MKRLLLFLLCLLTLDASAQTRPNVLLIVGDDQGWQDFGFMGHPHIKTPNIDRLAKESLSFTRGYVPSSLCCPSLASILTGKYAHQTKITGNEPPLPTSGRPADRYRTPEFIRQVEEINGYMASQPRLPAELAKAGYVSFQTGKWWHGNFKTGGFTDGMSHGETGRGGRHGDDGLKIGREGLRPVYDFIEKAGSSPFFVWYAPMLPHQPHNPPARLLEKYRAVAPTLFVAKYWAMCEWHDEKVGELLDYLKRTGKSDNTVVVYVTDNGWIQDPAKDAYRSDSKQSQYDGGLRTPILIKWPGKIKPQRVETPVSSIDIAPTLYNACGVRRPKGLPGIDLLDATAVRARKAIYGACYLHNAVDIRHPAKNLTYRWVISDGWKLIVPNPANVKEEKRAGRGTDVELYHIAADDNEQSNLALQQPDKLASLRKLLDEWWDAKP